MSIRTDVVNAARSRLGEGPRQAWHGLQWCGIWVLDVVHQAGLAHNIEWQIGRGFVLQNPEAFPPTTDPKPGDIGILEHNSAGHDVWHHVLLERVEDESAYCIAGNTGPSPGVVARQAFPLHRADLHWYSIEPVEAVP